MTIAEINTWFVGCAAALGQRITHRIGDALPSGTKHPTLDILFNWKLKENPPPIGSLNLDRQSWIKRKIRLIRIPTRIADYPS
jgi:hypothetical protein